MPQAKNVPLSRLKTDETLWPRQNISAVNVGSILEALRAGETMPPLVADQTTFVITDGVHRFRAFQKFFDDPTQQVSVVLKDYGGDRAAMLRDVVSLNTGRGHDLTSWDISHATDLAGEVGLSLDDLAKALHIRLERLLKMRESRQGRTLDGKKLALKRSLRHKVRLNQPLSEAQAEANEHLSGMSPIFHVNQLLTLIEADLLDVEDDHLAEVLALLAEKITAWVFTYHPSTQETA